MTQALAIIDGFYPVGSQQLAVDSTRALARDYYGVAPGMSFRTMDASYAISYTGEKNAGEVGPIIRYEIDHYALRLRSWQLMLESDPCNIVFNKFSIWAVGPGLRLQANPQKRVLESEGVQGIGGEDWAEDFNELVEARFKIFSEDQMSDYSNMVPLNMLEYRCLKEAIIGGDVLVVMRYVKGCVKVQLIDGGLVRTPLEFTRLNILGVDMVNPKTGYRIRHGVEIDERGEHVAYWVQNSERGLDALKYSRILARGSRSGALMAFMVYGNEYRLDNTRGIPLIAAVIETAKVMERYKSASLGAAEEVANLPYFIEHGPTSDGSNPQIKQYAKMRAGFVDPSLLESMSTQVSEFQNTVLATTGRTIYNMPNDSKISVPNRTMEIAFKDFYDTNFNYFAATLLMPPEVALSMYNSNYSASRAAVKDWEHTLDVKRKWFSQQFKQKVYNFWLDCEVLNGRIAAPGYLEALRGDNAMVLRAYRFARWEGDTVPSIDPKKEAEYWRLVLGSNCDHIPLGNAEQATAALTAGDVSANMEQVKKELERAKKAGLKPVEKGKPSEENPEGGKDGKKKEEEPDPE